MAIKLYWLRGKGREDSSKQNFGDYLSRDIVELVSGKEVVWCPAKKADLLAIGTILGRLTKAQGRLISRRVHVWGTGSASKQEDYSNKHYFHCVRGPLTAEMLPSPIKLKVFGDPGLLADQLRPVSTSIAKKYRVGLIPHYVDQGSPFLSGIENKFPKVKMINVFDSIFEIMDSILQCDIILSSSMHGLIVADSLGVPNCWLRLSDKFEEFKFHDYYQSQGLETQLIKEPQKIDPGLLDQLISQYSRPLNDRLKQGLVNSFPKSI